VAGDGAAVGYQDGIEHGKSPKGRPARIAVTVVVLAGDENFKPDRRLRISGMHKKLSLK
jgi:hypothetical protein